jgi:hypothetical protein
MNNILFIHHSCGGEFLAEAGLENGANAIFIKHPNGGGLRSRLVLLSYEVHEASYGSRIGQDTDIFDWLPKFSIQMKEIIACDCQDTSYQDGRRNHIVVYKSCFPNNAFKAEGRSPGNPAGPDLTLWNAKAAYLASLPEFQKHPEVLFVCVTAPPLAPPLHAVPLWKRLIKRGMGRYHCPVQSARIAREFNTWLCSPSGWLQGYPLTNVAVFNYYDILTGSGKSNFSMYPTGDGTDSHPSREGNEKAAEAFIPFLNHAAQRAGLRP